MHLEFIGLVTLTILAVKSIYNIIHFFYSVYLASVFGFNIDPRQYGPWAVVTGATDGIGKAYAKKFAQLGLNVILISRTKNKLQQVAEEIKRENNDIQVKTIAVDFTDGSECVYQRIRFELATFSVGILVNNVGMTFGSGPFLESLQSNDQIADIIHCNITSMVSMTQLVLPAMVKKKKGLIINVASLSGVGTTPFDTIYGATKAFADKYSRDLAVEVHKSGVICQSILPGFVATKMPKLESKSSFLIPKPATFVCASLNTLGIESRTGAFWFHKIMLYWMEMMYFFLPAFSQWLTMEFFRRRIKAKEIRKLKL